MDDCFSQLSIFCDDTWHAVGLQVLSGTSVQHFDKVILPLELESFSLNLLLLLLFHMQDSIEDRQLISAKCSANNNNNKKNLDICNLDVLLNI